MSGEAVRDAIRTGDLLGAYDLITAALADGSEQAELLYLQILVLARMGETERAQRLFAQHDQAATASEDWLALGARLLKDRAIAEEGPQRLALFREASRAYRSTHEQFGGYFSLINAASLALLAGNHAEARELARTVLAHPDIAAANSYFAAATAAEAWLLLDDEANAVAAATAARSLAGADLGARASTVRQLALLRANGGIATALADRLSEVLRPPPVLFYSGHMFVEDEQDEARLNERIDAVFKASGARIAYGALACGADILCAEAALRHGAELNLVLPFATADFIAQSVLPGGSGWLPRFEAALAAARSVTFASEAAYVGDPEQFHYGNVLAMGMALLRSAHLHARAEMLAVWDGAVARGGGGTGDAVASWTSLGHVSHIVDPGPINRTMLAAPAQPCGSEDVSRCQRAILFTDYSGFSRLGEQDLPRFWSDIMGHVATVLASADHAIDFRNSWGDAVFAVMTDVAVAARVALDIVGTPASAVDLGGMRIGLHYGPVYRMRDPITGQTGFIGTEVTRAARIEPVTPVGQVYVTQPFAAMLTLMKDMPFQLEYAGQVKLAKRYGTMALYRLFL